MQRLDRWRKPSGVMTEILCILGTVFAGVAAYRFRRRSRFWFGIGEIAVAFLQIHLAWIPTYNLLVGEGASQFAELIYRTTPVIVAVYLLVRGLDNIGEDLPPRWRELWPRLFGPISRSSG